MKVNGKSIVVSGPSAADGREVIQEKADSGETYTVYWKVNSTGSHLSVTVPDGQVFLLGDNRDGAYDSRKFGTVPLTDVVGVAKQIWFSRSNSGLRLGKWVEVN